MSWSKQTRQLFLLFISALTLLGAGGCISSYKHVLVSVVDDATGAPIADAKVRTFYYSQSMVSFASKRISEAITDTSGLVMIEGNYLSIEPALFKESFLGRLEPAFDVSIDNLAYQSSVMVTQTKNPIFGRPKNFIPTTPDVVVQISSRATEAFRQAKYEGQRKLDEEQAHAWFKNNPDFWPETVDDGSLRPKGAAASKLVDLRWQSASPSTLGTIEDLAAIKRVILTNLNGPTAKVDSVRWLSPTVVMARGSWYSGPLAAAGYTYVLSKIDRDWTVTVRYLTWVA